MKRIRLTESDLIRIVKRVINEQQDDSSLNTFKTYGNKQLVPLGFRGVQPKYDFQYMFTKKDGTRSTYVEIQLEYDSKEKNLYLQVFTGVGELFKILKNADINKINSIFAEVKYLDNLMIKNFASKGSQDPDNALLQQEKFKKMLIGKGYQFEEL